MTLSYKVDKNNKINFFWNDIKLKCSISNNSILEFKRMFNLKESSISADLENLINFEVYCVIHNTYTTDPSNIPVMLDIKDKKLIYELLK